VDHVPPVLTLYSRPGCHLCDEARAILAPLCRALGLTLHEANIENDPALTERYGWSIPVAALDGDDVLAWPFTRATARHVLLARLRRLTAPD
jgi:hypothetical protein